MVLAKVNRTVIKLLFKRLYGCSAPAEKSVNGANSSHTGKTNALSPEHDDNLESISPYQMWNLN